MENTCVKFDWAAKYILRDKADQSIFEELVSVITGRPIHIVEFIESESNKKTKDDKFNRVDIKATDSQGDIILVEIQQSFEYYFLQRILFGTAKTITEHIKGGYEYENVKKVYSINILYFDLGRGDDYLYHGMNQLTGVNKGDVLLITKKEENGIKMIAPKDIFPEYFIVRVNQFDSEEDTPLCQWMRYLKDGKIDDGTTLPGLKKAMEKLNVLNMTKQDRKEYEEHLYNLYYQKNVMLGNRMEGELVGEQRGFEKGVEMGVKEGAAETLSKIKKKMRQHGMDENIIRELTQLE